MVPYFPFKGIPRFYDIGGFLARPEVFQRIVDIFVARYAGLEIDSVAGMDARGFVLGPPIALALKKPFIMIRKKVRGCPAPCFARPPPFLHGHPPPLRLRARCLTALSRTHTSASTARGLACACRGTP